MVSMAVIVAYGVRADGVREVLGVDIGRVRTWWCGGRSSKGWSPAACAA